MEFTLFLKGKVKSNGTPKVKHEIRIKFHEQLNELLNLFTSNNKNSWKEKRMNTNKFYKSRHGKHFICLITENLDTYAKLNVYFYVPKQTSFKDIDNKLKTICAALSLPGIRQWQCQNH